MSIAEKITTISQNVQKVYDAGYEAGKGGGGKFASLVDKTITEVSAGDLAGHTLISASAFSRCDKLTSITIPASVKTIDTYAFNQCTALTSVIFEEGSACDRIYTSAFYQCSMAEITLPASILEIASGAFSWCSYLKTFRINRKVPPKLDAKAFGDYTKLNRIIVPAGCAAAYKSATNWSAYADIIVEATE